MHPTTLREFKEPNLLKKVDLSNAMINLDELLKRSQQKILDIVISVTGTKCLVLDPSIIGLFNHLFTDSSQELKKYDVIDIQEISWTDLDVQADHILYISRPETDMVLQISSQIKVSGQSYSYQIHYVPQRSFLSNQLLRDQGIFDQLRENLFDCPIGLIPYDTDVLSMGLENCFTQMNLEGDESGLMYCASALLQAQEIFGYIPDIQVLGEHSKKVLDLMLRITLENEEESYSESIIGIHDFCDDNSDNDEDNISNDSLNLVNSSIF